MSYLGPCGRREKHEPHTVTPAPEGGVGGHYCDGQASAPTQTELDMIEAFQKRGLPADHGSDRYDYVEVIGAPPDVQPSGEWFDLLLAEACPDCRANVFVTWAPQDASSWTVQIAHDDTCPTPHLKPEKENR